MNRIAQITTRTLLIFSIASPLVAQPIGREAPLVAGDGAAAGNVILTQTPRGVLIRVAATGLTPGWHGMHIHMTANCGDPGFKLSGGHVHASGIDKPVHGLLNPDENEAGDLPNIFVAADGSANAEVYAPGLSLADVAGRLDILDADGSAIIIHASPDDHLTQPIGGAGARVACAAIK